MSVISGKLVYSKYGDPLTELSLVEEAPPASIQPGEAHVRVLYSPVNPSDILTVKGNYPLKPPFPAVPGLEGVVEVVKGTTFQPGERALIMKMGWGMWRHEGVVEEKHLFKIPKELKLEAAATLVVNPCTAYLMLKQIVQLNPGDVLIQDAANSALGQVVIQLAKATGIKTINVIRNRPNYTRHMETVDMLKSLGADEVITDSELKGGLPKLNLGLPAPKLALECVGGPLSADLAASLVDGGTMVVYGVLGGQPAHVYQNDLIFRGIQVRGFWLSKWVEDHKPEEFASVMQELIAMYIGGKLRLPRIRKVPVAQWKDAIKHATQGLTNEKVLLQFN